jgi:hypothetical protein
VSIAPPSPQRVGENTTLRATVERTGGTGSLPRVTWESSRPNVLRVDGSTGAATAVSEGQATVFAIAGNARGEIPVTVQAAAAPVVAPPYGQQQPAAARGYAAAETPPSRPAASPDELRARAEAVLRNAATNMIAALNTRNAATAGVLFGDGQNAEAIAMLNSLKDFSRVSATLGRTVPVHVTERSGVLEYQIDFRYENSMGIERRRTLSMRAEAERSGDTWTVARQKLTGGWR